MMKRILVIMLASLMLIGLVVSCKNEVSVPADELIEVSFENETSRALSSNLETFAKDEYYWKYAASKADNSNLVSGQTATYDEAGARWIKEGEPGFGTGTGTAYQSFKVQGFSQGLWNFKLFAYKDSEGTQLVYSGETTGVLLKVNGNHTVKAVVSPAQTGTGTLVVKIVGEEAVSLDRAQAVDAAANTKVRLGIEKIGASDPVRELSIITDDYEGSLEAGAYKITVQFTNDDGTIVYASGSVVSTVYSNLRTTVKGNLTEAVTYADFEAEQNPDIITTTIGTESITQGTDSETVQFTSSSTSAKVSATMPTSAAKTLIAQMEQNLDAKISTSTSTTSDLTLHLSVNTTEATASTITYEIGMEATLVYEKIDAEENVKTTTRSAIDEVADFVTVQIELQKGLSDVRVIHDVTEMTECESLTALNAKTKASEKSEAGFFFYDDSADDKAVLYIRTYTFSPFRVSYKVSEYVAAIGSVCYKSLSDAVAAATTGDTITLIKDVYVEFGFGPMFTVAAGKTITLDLSGHRIDGLATDSKASALIQVEGALTVIDSTDTDKNGTGDGRICLLASSPDERSIPGYGSYTILNHGTLIIESGWIYNESEGGASFAIDSYSNNGKNVSLTINGGKVSTAYALSIRQAIFTNTTNDVVINGGVVGSYWIQNYGTSSKSAVGTLTINDVTALYSYRLDLGYSIDNGYAIKADEVIVSIKGGSFRSLAVYAYNNAETHIITGGSFTSNVSDYCEEGSFAREVNDKYVVLPVSEAVDSDYAAKIGDSGYFTLSAAIDSVVASDEYTTIKLMKDLVEPVLVRDGRRIILDLNGKTLTNNSSNSDTFNVFNSSYAIVCDSSSGVKGSIVSNNGAAIWSGEDADDKSEIEIWSGVTLTGSTNAISVDAGTVKITIEDGVILNDGIAVNSGSTVIDKRN